VFEKIFVDLENNRKVLDAAARLIQMLSILSGLSTGDDKQKAIEKTLHTLKGSLKKHGRSSHIPDGAQNISAKVGA